MSEYSRHCLTKGKGSAGCVKWIVRVKWGVSLAGRSTGCRMPMQERYHTKFVNLL